MTLMSINTRDILTREGEKSLSPEESKFIEDLFNQYGESLWRYAYTCVQDAEYADELISDLFHTASRKPKQVMTYDSAFGWLIGVLKKKIKKSQETRRRYARRFISLDEETLDEFLPSDIRPTEDRAELELTSGTDTLAKIQAALSPEEFYILKRITLNKATHKAVAQELGITVWDSQKRLERIRKKLHRIFPEYPKGK